MQSIGIEWRSDWYDCETCGPSYAEGALVKLNGGTILDLKPVAHCYAGQSWDREQVYRLILEHLGYAVASQSEGET
jgi:hypothetical protein